MSALEDYAAMTAPDMALMDDSGHGIDDPRHIMNGPPSPRDTDIDGQIVPAGIVEQVQQVMSAVPGLRVLSGARDEHQNRQHKGVPGSLHMLGRAVDLSGTAKQLQDASVIADRLGATENSIHNPGRGMILHLGW